MVMYTEKPAKQYFLISDEVKCPGTISLVDEGGNTIDENFAYLTETGKVAINTNYYEGGTVDIYILYQTISGE